MLPVLYPANERKFQSQGLGTLTDAISCAVREVRNGEYELEMVYPESGIHFSEIQDRCIILAIPSPYREPEPFRIYRITTPMDGVCTIRAQHVGYDLSGVPVSPCAAEDVIQAMQAMKDNAAVSCPFEFWTDMTNKAPFSVAVPMSIRAALGGKKGSVLATYGGEFEWKRWQVKLHGKRGQDNGVVIRYGKNLTDIEQDRNIANVSTGIYPFWADKKANVLVTCEPKVVAAPGTHDFTRVLPVDFTRQFKSQPTPEQLQAAAEHYITVNRIGQPVVSITAKFLQLDQMSGYEHLALLEKCDLCDTVTVQFERLGINATAQIVEIRTDVLRGRYESVKIGDARPNIADTIVQQQEALEEVRDPSFLEKAVDAATGWITNGRGYMVAIKDANGNWQEICSLDTPDIASAINVWRWNNGGLGHSGTGYNGQYTLALTQDGKIVADSITTGTLDAALVKIKNLVVDHLKSEKDGNILEATGAKLTLYKGQTRMIDMQTYDDDQARIFMNSASTTNNSYLELAPWKLVLGAHHAGGEDILITSKGWAGAGGEVRAASVKHPLLHAGEDRHITIDNIPFTRAGLRSLLGFFEPLVRNVGYGSLAQFTVPHAGDYKMFLLNVADSASADKSTMITAYYQGGQICGVGGWSGTQTDMKQIYFVTITATGSGYTNWKIEDLRSHVLTTAGGLQSSQKAYIRNIYGVI